MRARGAAVRVIAHRGSSARAPENTLPAFEEALRSGCDGIEFDVRLTADGGLVIMHDDDVARTTDGTGYASRMTLDEVRRLDASARFGARPARVTVPTFEEVLDLLAGRTFLIVELKGSLTPDGYGSAAPVAEAIVPSIRNLPDVLVSSFDPAATVVVRSLLPSVPTAITTLAGGRDWGLQTAVEVGHVECHVPEVAIEPAYLDAAHAAGLRVLGWTVNDAARLRELAAMGNDGVFTDDPHAALEALGR